MPQIPGFDHCQEEVVDVVQHETGEFVQVWNQRHDGSFDSGARVILSYYRTAWGAKDVVRIFTISDGEFEMVEVSRRGRRLLYRGGNGWRWEMDLPSGLVMVDDEKTGSRIRTEFYEQFDRPRT